MEPIFKKPEIYEKFWGREIWIANSSLYCGKILEFNKGFYSSLHFHKIKTETWYVLSGNLTIEYLDEKGETKLRDLLPGDVVHIDPGVVHKVIAKEDIKILEVSTQHFEEDSIRLQASGKF